jgi:hypothetical protein
MTGEPMAESDNIKIETLAESDLCAAWKAEEPDGETTYNLQINNVTINFFEEEWKDFIGFARELVKR